MVSIVSRVGSWFAGAGLTPAPPRVSPYQEAGASGTAVWGGYPENVERDPQVSGQNRYRTASDMLANISIIAAGLRYFLNLAAAPTWKAEPAKAPGAKEPTDSAKKAAELVNDVLFNGMATNWSRIVRRQAMFRFHGFGIHEWTAKRRTDGQIGLEDIEARPQHTIEQWAVDDGGRVIGVWQRSPQTGQLLGIPRDKFVYHLDDALTDSPEGLGLFRHLVEPANRMKRYLKLEGQGFERDLRGIPVGRAPLAEIRAAVKAGSLKKEDGDALMRGLRSFVKNQVREKDTGLILDSTTYTGTTADGNTISGTSKWALELLSASGAAFADIGKAIERTRFDMATILGTESLLLGSGASSGNRSLGEDKSKNLYIAVNATTTDMAAAITRDAVARICDLNGIAEEDRPTLKAEDASAKDAEAIAAVLRDMATAGAVLAPDDPAIDEVRTLLGLPAQPEQDDETIAQLMATRMALPPADAAEREDARSQAALDAKANDKPAPGKPPAKKA